MVKNDLNRSDWPVKSSSEGPVRGCTPLCAYFPNSDTTEWVYDENPPHLKKRADKKGISCRFDGHQITCFSSVLCPRGGPLILKK